MILVYFRRTTGTDLKTIAVSRKQTLPTSPVSVTGCYWLLTQIVTATRRPKHNLTYCESHGNGNRARILSSRTHTKTDLNAAKSTMNLVVNGDRKVSEPCSQPAASLQAARFSNGTTKHSRHRRPKGLATPLCSGSAMPP